MDLRQPACDPHRESDSFLISSWRSSRIHCYNCVGTIVTRLDLLFAVVLIEFHEYGLTVVLLRNRFSNRIQITCSAKAVLFFQLSFYS